jgi:hypothetical protein
LFRNQLNITRLLIALARQHVGGLLQLLLQSLVQHFQAGIRAQLQSLDLALLCQYAQDGLGGTLISGCRCLHPQDGTTYQTALRTGADLLAAQGLRQGSGRAQVFGREGQAVEAFFQWGQTRQSQGVNAVLAIDGHEGFQNVIDLSQRYTQLGGACVGNGDLSLDLGHTSAG